MNRLALLLLLTVPRLADAEYDGDELLDLMHRPASRETALAQVDDVRIKWDGTLFCVAGANPQAAAFGAVQTYLEAHPQERYRPRRYLIIQGLRSAYPCPPQ